MKPFTRAAVAVVVFAGGYFTRLLFEGKPLKDGGWQRTGATASQGGEMAAQKKDNRNGGPPANPNERGRVSNLRPSPDGTRLFAKGEGGNWLRSWGNRPMLDDGIMDSVDLVRIIDRMNLEEIAELAGVLECEFPRKSQASEDKEKQPDSLSEEASVESIAPYRFHELLYMAWGERAPAQALAHLLAVTGVEDDDQDYEKCLQAFLGAWASHDAAGAAAGAVEVANKLPGFVQTFNFEHLSADMARNHPMEALQMARNLPPESRPDRCFETIMGVIASADPAKAAQVGVQLAAGKPGTKPLMTAMHSWMSNDPAAAEQWALSYDGPGRGDAMAAVIGAKMEKGGYLPASVEFGKVAGLEDTEAVHDLARRLVESFRKDSSGLAAARDWVNTLPQGSARNVATIELAEQWVDKDAPAASEWIATLPNGPSRDACVSPLIFAIVNADPARALTWAKSMTDGSEDRHYALYLSLRSLKGKDNAAYQEAYKALSPEDQKGAIAAYERTKANDPFAEPEEEGK